MRRAIHWVLDVLRDPETEPEVHFHQGPETTPAVCYDAHCASPRLSV